MYLETIQKKLLQNNDEKLKFASNRIRTLMFQIKICLADLMDVIDVLCHLCSELNQVPKQFREKVCDMSEHSAYRELKSPGDIRSVLGHDNIPEAILKQRSPEWFDLRRTTKVTGSVAHTALGLETLCKQKEFVKSVLSDRVRSEPNELQKRAMEHGSLNEINGIATLLAKVMPVYYPEFVYYEEGAYSVRNDKNETILIVSPDGSLRNGKTVISVEIKCPFSEYIGSQPVYYKMKPRHVVQCQLEAHVLQSTDHLYLSWSKETTTVFRMTPNADFINSVLDEVDKTYYGRYPAMPTKTSESAKNLKEKLNEESKNAEFLGEFQSIMAQCTPRLPNAKTSKDVYYEQKETVKAYETESLTLEKISQFLLKGLKEMSEAYAYQKPMASEVLVYLMSDMDRSWNREIGHGLPIAYLFKGYSLSMKTARHILDDVLDACYSTKAHVPCITFDGQFARLKDYDESDLPLTLFALQRKFWSEVQKNSKRQIINKISDLYKNPDWAMVADAKLSDEGIIEVNNKYLLVQNGDGKCLPIQTSLSRLEEKTKHVCSVENNLPTDAEHIDYAGLEYDVQAILESVDITSSTGTLSNTEEDTDEEQEHFAKHLQRDSCAENISAESDSMNDTVRSVTTTEGQFLNLNDNDYTIIWNLLRDTKRQKWQNVSSKELKQMLMNGEEMNKQFTGQELVPIVKFLNLKMKSSKTAIHQSLRKSEKINAICKLIGNNTSVAVPKKVSRAKSIKSLASLCIMVLQKKSYPKEALTMSYARSMWPRYKDTWFETASVEEEVEIDFIDEYGKLKDRTKFKPIYSPEYSSKRNQLEVRVMDGTHIRTNIKSKLIRNGLANVRIQPWKNVALSGNTDLLPAMLEIHGKIMHQQSDHYVRTMFSEEVESAMKMNGDIDEAQFCQLFREWHESEDKAGISAEERVKRSLRFRDWLLKGYDFPPATQYVRGIPRVTFEGLVCSIDAHVFLYAMIKGGSYNWRSVSTLVAENFMGELAERSQNNHGVPSGNTLRVDMKKISELHSMRLNPNRSFQMKTFKSRAYEVPQDIGICIDDEMGPDVNSDDKFSQKKQRTYGLLIPEASHSIESLTKCLSTVQVRDHQFDKRKGAKKQKCGRISKWNEQPKGVQPVRYYYKVDESKILPSLRFGIPASDLDNKI